MKKIPTIFDRDWDGDRSRVLNVPNGACQWVFDGEGVATQKIDGTCCMARGGRFFKRRELSKGKIIPHDFEVADVDQETGKIVGWEPVGNGPEDRWHREAFDRESSWPDGTYELVGPKVQGNPEAATENKLIPHQSERLVLTDVTDRTFEGLKAYLGAHNIEGIVFHHPDGRMGKIKGRDFGVRRA